MKKALATFVAVLVLTACAGGVDNGSSRVLQSDPWLCSTMHGFKCGPWSSAAEARFLRGSGGNSRFNRCTMHWLENHYSEADVYRMRARRTKSAGRAATDACADLAP